MNEMIVQSINSIVFSMLLFIMAAGLSLIFGHTNFINLAHGSFYVLGGYIGITAINQITSCISIRVKSINRRLCQ